MVNFAKTIKRGKIQQPYLFVEVVTSSFILKRFFNSILFGPVNKVTGSGVKNDTHIHKLIENSFFRILSTNMLFQNIQTYVYLFILPC